MSPRILGAVGLALLSIASGAHAQDVGGEAPAAAPAAPAAAAPAAPPPPTVTTTTTTIPTIIRNQTVVGPPAPDINAHLSPGSRPRTDINQLDTLDTNGSAAPTVMRGASGAPGVIASEVRGNAGIYVVQTGDTLSSISQRIYGQPWMWPKLWSLNPQLQNPHWIYPGDEIRLTGEASAGGSGGSQTLGAGDGRLRRQLVPEDGVFLREYGYIDDPAKGIMGEIVGGVEPVQMMGEGQRAYMVLKPGEKVSVGQRLTVFHEVRDPPRVQGARRPPGKIVALTGTIEVEYVNLNTRVVRGLIVESTDPIERGHKIGMLNHKYELVPTRKAEKNITSRVLTSMYPHAILGQNQVVFIDRGEQDGLRAGNRLFITRRGDTWRRTLETTTNMASSRIEMSHDESVHVDPVPLHGDEQDFPEEVVAELRVVRLHKQSALALVTHASVEILPGDRAIAREGF